MLVFDHFLSIFVHYIQWFLAYLSSIFRIFRLDRPFHLFIYRIFQHTYPIPSTMHIQMENFMLDFWNTFNHLYLFTSLLSFLPFLIGYFNAISNPKYENKITNEREDRWFCHTDYMILLPYLNVPNDRMRMNNFALCVGQHEAHRYNMGDRPQHCIRYALCQILMDSFHRTIFFSITKTIQESSIIIQDPQHIDPSIKIIEKNKNTENWNILCFTIFFIYFSDICFPILKGVKRFWLEYWFQ